MSHMLHLLARWREDRDWTQCLFIVWVSRNSSLPRLFLVIFAQQWKGVSTNTIRRNAAIDRQMWRTVSASRPFNAAQLANGVDRLSRTRSAPFFCSHRGNGVSKLNSLSFRTERTAPVEPNMCAKKSKKRTKVIAVDKWVI